MDKALASVKGHALFVFRGYFRNDVADALLHGILFQTAQAHPANAPAKMGGSNEVSDGGPFPGMWVQAYTHSGSRSPLLPRSGSPPRHTPDNLSRVPEYGDKRIPAVPHPRKQPFRSSRNG